MNIKKTAIEAEKIIGAILLLIIIIMGISSFLLFLEPKKFWVFESDDGREDSRALISVVGAIPLWLWILYNARRAKMSDDEKKNLGQQFHDGDSDTDMR